MSVETRPQGLVLDTYYILHARRLAAFGAGRVTCLCRRRCGVEFKADSTQSQRRHDGTASSDRLQEFAPPEFSVFALFCHRRLPLQRFLTTSLEGRGCICPPLRGTWLRRVRFKMKRGRQFAQLASVVSHK